MKVFVYGTLLKGMQRTSVLSNSTFIGPSMLHNADLFDLGNFPGIKNGDGIVIGELYEIDNPTLTLLDNIEGYNRNSSASLYIRKEVAVIKLLDNTYTNAFCYFYHLPIYNTPIIFHGDYRRYLLEKENGYQWILAYGSNISSSRIIERVGKIKGEKKGFLKGYKLVFNKKASKKNAVYANIAYMGLKEKCPAVAYKLTSEQVKVLDKFEGVTEQYLRISMIFSDNNEIKSIMQGYIANPAKLAKGIPETKYLNYIRRGYKEHNLDNNYLDNILSK